MKGSYLLCFVNYYPFNYSSNYNDKMLEMQDRYYFKTFIEFNYYYALYVYILECCFVIANISVGQ